MRLYFGIMVVWVMLSTGVSAGETAFDALMAKTFQTQCGLLASAADQTGHAVIAGKDGYYFLVNELRYCAAGPFWGENALKVSKASKPEWADPVPAILDFHKQLGEQRIELILMPVPPKVAIYPDKLIDAPAARVNLAYVGFVKLMRDAGVTVIDLEHEFFKVRAESKEGLYCKTDSHWTPYACEVAAQCVKKHLKTQKWFPQGADANYKVQVGEIDVAGDLNKLKGGEDAGSEKLRAAMVISKGNPTENSKSPIILLGDSHCLVFHSGEDMLATDCGLVDHLAAELNLPIDLLGVRGSGATPARIAFRGRAKEPEYLRTKKVVIWCFTAREFTETQGWRKVPILSEKK